MIGQLTVNISAKDPTRKCETFRAFVGSPSNVRIVGVPSSLGNWKIETVYIAVNYPDNRSVGKTCKPGVGVYVATVEGSTLPGTSLLGYTVKADGIDENGAPVIGYVLGKGDVEIVDADATLTPGETTYYIHLLQSRPETPHKGDAYVDGGVWWFYNGSAWVTLGGTFAGNGWAQYPQSHGGDGKWHRVIIADGTLAYDEQGFDEPPDAAPFALKSELTAEASRAAAAEGANAEAIEAEETRAKAAEQANAEAISAEASRAAAAEGANAEAIKAIDNNVVKLNGDQTITGEKTFSVSPKVPTVSSTDDNSKKAASTGWVVSKLAAWWATIKATLTKSDVGLGNVDNTSDASKPVSEAMQTALNAKANDNAVVKLNGDQTISGVNTFSQSPLVPTIQSTDDNSQKSASTGWVTSKISAWWNAIKSTVTFTKSQVGLGNVDNTSDANKPISAATQNALNAKANDNAVVKLNGDQTISGHKNFGSISAESVSGSAFAKAVFPSNVYVEAERLYSGAQMTAPSDGWFLFVSYDAIQNSNIIVRDAETNYIISAANGIGSITNPYEYPCLIFVPASKGQIATLSYSGSASISSFRFYYSNSSQQ